jgi:hypothetical protein
MARSLDSNIYGIDKTDYANGIASDALGSPSSLTAIEQSARSKGGGADSNDNADAKIVHDKGKAESSKGNH